MAFPCNQFGAQEPGTNEAILAFATDKYQANFPMFAKIEVNGDGACELYQMLRSAQPEADGSTEMPWNFTKFLVDGKGQVTARLSPKMTPEEIGGQLADLL